MNERPNLTRSATARLGTTSECSPPIAGRGTHRSRSSRRALPECLKILPVLAFAAAAAVPVTAAAANRRSFHFKEGLSGAQISATEAVFKIHDSRVGNGAGVQTVKLNGLSGSDKEIIYYKNATAMSHGTFTLSAPDASGISKLTGKGTDTNGTGKLKGFTSTYTYSGTFNINTCLLYTSDAADE